MSTDKIRPKKGLEGVVFDETNISKAVPEKKALVYRGYPVHELSENCSFEEVAYLLWNDDLPGSSELKVFCERERSHRNISSALSRVIEEFPISAHPMDGLRTAVSFLGMEDPDAWDNSPAANEEKAFKLLAKLPIVTAALQRRKQNLTPIPPRNDLSFAENFFHMCFGEVPDAEIVRAFDVSLILYAEHGFNVSTFTARVVASSLSEMYASVTAAIGSLKGPLHGGANEQVMHMLKEIGSADNAQAWIDSALAEKKKVMGFGHRLYRIGDSRVPTMSAHRDRLAELTNNGEWLEISKTLENTMVGQKNIYPNLDFPSGPAYFMMGFDIEMFTPIFAMSRITGWASHVMEQLANNRLVRPLSDYSGPEERQVVGLSSRS